VNIRVKKKRAGKMASPFPSDAQTAAYPHSFIEDLTAERSHAVTAER
jgi:hypothetical protein